MQIHVIDIAIVLTYLIVVVVIGFLFSRRAGQNMNSYFLGGKTLPRTMLGIANASSMFDITGTMWLVYILFVYGMKGCWMPWLWPTFNQILLPECPALGILETDSQESGYGNTRVQTKQSFQTRYGQRCYRHPLANDTHRDSGVSGDS